MEGKKIEEHNSPERENTASHPKQELQPPFLSPLFGPFISGGSVAEE